MIFLSGGKEHFYIIFVKIFTDMVTLIVSKVFFFFDVTVADCNWRRLLVVSLFGGLRSSCFFMF